MYPPPRMWEPRARLVFRVLLLLVLLFIEGRANAALSDSSGISVHREAGASMCPSARELMSRVVAYVRTGNVYDAFVDVTFRREARELSADIEVHSSDGAKRVRTLKAPIYEHDEKNDECATLGAAVAFAIALQVDPDAVIKDAPLPEPVPPPPPLAHECPSPPIQKTTASSVLPPPASARRPLQLAAGVGIAPGLLPSSVAPSAALSTMVSVLDHLAVDLGARYFPEVHTDDKRFGFGLFHFSLGACMPFRMVAGRFVRGVFAGCAHLDPGEIYAVVYRPIPTNPGGRFWLGAEASLRAGLELGGSFEVSVEGAALFALSHPVFRVDGEQSPVFSQPFLSPLATLYAGLHFP